MLHVNIILMNSSFFLAKVCFLIKNLLKILFFFNGQNQHKKKRNEYQLQTLFQRKLIESE